MSKTGDTILDLLGGIASGDAGVNAELKPSAGLYLLALAALAATAAVVKQQKSTR